MSIFLLGSNFIKCVLSVRVLIVILYSVPMSIDGDVIYCIISTDYLKCFELTIPSRSRYICFFRLCLSCRTTIFTVELFRILHDGLGVDIRSLK